MSTNEEITQMLADIEARESKLGDSQRRFIDDVQRRFAESGALTESQDEVITLIWDRVTS